MRDVYGKAELCIAATHAESGDVGLFCNRDSEQLTPVMVEATWPSNYSSFGWPTPGPYLFGFYHISFGDAIDLAPLNQRAWVAQERFLSPRTLHFTQSLLFWECHTSFTNENDRVPNSSRSKSANDILRASLNDVRMPESNLGPTQNIALHSISNDTKLRKIYRAWRGFLVHYISCGITKESDILVALVGVAGDVGHAMSDCLLAGLWKAHFIEELCWRTWGDTCRSSIWRAPSWSWASLSGKTSTVLDQGDDACKMAEIVEFDISTKPSGEVERGSVLVECRLLPATIHGIASDGHAMPYNAYGVLDKSVWTSFIEETDPGGGNPISVMLDVKDDPCYNADQAVEVQLLVLLKEGEDEDEDEDEDHCPSLDVTGICVLTSRNQDGAFERVGYFTTSDKTAELVLAAYDQAGVQKILLV
jgi:hypothetical protein